MNKETNEQFSPEQILSAKADIDKWFLELIDIGYGKIEINFARSNDLIEVIPSPKLRHRSSKKE